MTYIGEPDELKKWKRMMGASSQTEDGGRVNFSVRVPDDSSKEHLNNVSMAVCLLSKLLGYMTEEEWVRDKDDIIREMELIGCRWYVKPKDPKDVEIKHLESLLDKCKEAFESCDIDQKVRMIDLLDEHEEKNKRRIR